MSEKPSYSEIRTQVSQLLTRRRDLYEFKESFLEEEFTLRIKE